MTKHILPLAGLLLSPLAIAACDAQTGTGYAGEALLTMTGSVSGTELDGDVVPALAFGDVFSDSAHLVDVDVSGEFPANFSVRVFDAPSRALLDDVLTLPGEPRGAFAQIVAVDADHPDTLAKWEPYKEESKSCDSELGCTRDLTVYGEDSSEVLYTEHSECDAEWENCTTTSEGDPAAALNPSRWFHGVVANYGVVYFEDPVPARTLAGAVYGELEAGYHLVRLDALTESEANEMERCNEQAGELGLATFNQENGTSYASEDDVAPKHEGAVGFAQREAFFDLGCRADTGMKITVVETTEDHPLKLEIVQDSSELDLPVLF